MRKSFVFILLMMLTVGSPAAQGVREPVWAGQFYPASPEQLSSMLEGWLNKNGEPLPGGKPSVLIAPHAGYIYSGQIAAASYRQAKDKEYQTVVVIAPSHHYGFKGGSIYMRGGYRSPLGVLTVDEELAKKLAEWTGYGYIPKAHAKEHAVEVHVPFIQKSLPAAKICPIVLGVPDRMEIINLADALEKAAGEKDILIVASTDMSHFLSKEKAQEKDKATINIIRNWKISRLIRKLENRENIMCGGAGVAAALTYAQRRENCRMEILQHDDSTSGGGPESRVVGYMSAAVWCGSCEKPEFTESDRKELFHIARTALNSYIRDHQLIIPLCQNPKLLPPQGVFVTLHKNGHMRGCIGFIEGGRPLYTNVAEAAVLAAVKDARFQPVRPQELDEITLEISVLTPPVKINNPKRIQVGRHGLIIDKAGKRGLLLPQVAADNKWSRETFLAQTCLKAGLSRGDWKNGADMYIFEACVFHEEE
jgi:hypothetical protein